MCKSSLIATLAFLLTLSVLPSAGAQETDVSDDNASASQAGWWTAGGQYFWTDYLIHDQWRVQRNVYTGHYRLLDADNRRRTWGSYRHCQTEFERFHETLQLKEFNNEVVILLHGMGRTRHSMEGLGAYLQDASEYSAIHFSYASTRDRIESHAKALRNVIRQLKGVRKVHFVGHSMGNLVLRSFLADIESMHATETSMPDIGRIVMLAPPNNGSALARRLADNELFRIVAGTGGAELADRWPEVVRQLPTPTVDFGIIAGRSGHPLLSNPLLPGEDDLVVTIEETKLGGASDFRVAPVIHTLIMDDAEVKKYVLSFLQHGYFTSCADRHPISVIR